VHVNSVLITGTTSGLGRALLEHYATSGVKVISVNRRRVAELEARYPSVRFECLDVRSNEDVERLVNGLATSGELPDVFVLNAGINRPDNDETFDLSLYREVLETNLFGVLNFIRPLTTLPASGERHIVAINSMVTYAGNPYGLGYQTSKGALKACFDVWAKMYRGTDLVFKQVILGPIETSMYTMEGKLPGWMSRIKGLSSASMNGTVRAVSGFAQTRRRTLIHPWRAFAVFGAFRLARWLVPGLFDGHQTLAGRPRRKDLRSRPGSDSG
jgi:NAD(P)-dependent dehydrogenase (short-subunit alcohol dehydrogenase family)